MMESFDELMAMASACFKEVYWEGEHAERAVYDLGYVAQLLLKSGPEGVAEVESLHRACVQSANQKWFGGDRPLSEIPISRAADVVEAVLSG